MVSRPPPSSRVRVVVSGCTKRAVHDVHDMRVADRPVNGLRVRSPRRGTAPPTSDSFLAGIGAFAGFARLIVGVSPDCGTTMMKTSFETCTSARSPTGAIGLRERRGGLRGASGALKPVTRTWLRESVPSQRSDTRPFAGAVQIDAASCRSGRSADCRGLVPARRASRRRRRRTPTRSRRRP